MKESDEMPLRERFIDAVQEGDVAALRALAPRRADLADFIDAPLFAFDAPALAFVAGGGDVDVVDALLSLGADPNRKSDWWAGGFHPLYSANAAVAERLIAGGAIPDACALAHLDRADELSALLAREPDRVHERGGDGQTPLHFARSIRVADILLAAGADVDARDRDHRGTPAEWMIGDRADVARHLVSLGAATDIFLAASLGITPRVRSLLVEDRDLLTLRTGQGAYGEQPPSSFHIYYWSIGANVTPLMAAAKFAHDGTLATMKDFASMGQQLVLACHIGDEHEARNIVDADPATVRELDRADAATIVDEAWRNNVPGVKLMLSLGFDPCATRDTDDGVTALHAAAYNGSVELVRALLDVPRMHACLTLRDSRYDGTPLGWCRHAHAERPDDARYDAIEALLVDAGAPE